MSVTTHDKIDTPTNDLDDDDWYCIQTKPYHCDSCSMDFKHIHDHGKIVVWPDLDDKNMLKIAEAIQKDDADPRIKPYERSLGPCISYYDV